VSQTARPTGRDVAPEPTNRPVGRRIAWDRRVNALAGAAFVVGGSLFAIGAALAQGDVGGPLLAASVYLAGGVFFCSGGYLSVLLATNLPHRRRDGAYAVAPWRWWAREPRRLDWLSAAVLFAGTIVFAFNLVDSFIAELTPAQADRLIWSPDMVGCALFLVSGHLALVDICGRWWLGWRRHDLGWRIAVINQLGSILFMVAAVASFVHRDGDLLAAGLANWGTLTGALCFAIAGATQEFERPVAA
jgi:hypothetical protein